MEKYLGFLLFLCLFWLSSRGPGPGLCPVVGQSHPWRRWPGQSWGVDPWDWVPCLPESTARALVFCSGTSAALPAWALPRAPCPRTHPFLIPLVSSAPHVTICTACAYPETLSILPVGKPVCSVESTGPGWQWFYLHSLPEPSHPSRELPVHSVLGSTVGSPKAEGGPGVAQTDSTLICSTKRWPEVGEIFKAGMNGSH